MSEDEREFTTNPERCPDHDVRLVGGSCPLKNCDYEQTAGQ